MLEIDLLEDIAALRESVDIECKLAQGRDGKCMSFIRIFSQSPPPDFDNS